MLIDLIRDILKTFQPTYHDHRARRLAECVTIADVRHFEQLEGRLLLSVGSAPTNTLIVSSADPGVVGQAVTFTVAVAPASSSASVPTGTVTFSIDGTAQPGVTLVNGLATMSLSTLNAGTHAITAHYGGDTNFAASASAPTIVTVASASTTTLAASPTSVASGTPVALTATVTSGGKPVTRGTVTFYNGATTLATRV